MTDLTWLDLLFVTQEPNPFTIVESEGKESITCRSFGIYVSPEMGSAAARSAAASSA